MLYKNYILWYHTIEEKIPLNSVQRCRQGYMYILYICVNTTLMLKTLAALYCAAFIII